MVINENNSYINSFSKGMNSDITYDLILKELYVYAKNVRITKNLLLGGANEYSTLHEGIIAPVYSGVLTDWDINNTPNVVSTKPEILAVDSVERLCTIVTREEQNLCVYRLEIDEESNKITYAQLIWTAKDYWSDEDWHQVSTVLYKELDNVVKLYIATGKDPVISLRVDDWGVEHILKGKDGQDTPVDFIINNRRMPENRVFIDSVISGRLKTQLVLYTYRYYNKYLNTTQLAPLTNKILVIDPSRHKENGNAEDTETSIGFTLTIDTTGFDNWYDRIQVFRLSYIHPGEDAEVALIYDDDIKAKLNVFSLNDVGIEPLKSLTMEEFAAMSGIIIIPLAIAQNQSYMFGANVKDDTIIRGIDIDPNFKDSDVKLIQTEVLLSKYSDGRIPVIDNTETFDTFVDSDIQVSKYFKLRGINFESVKNNYNNIFTSSLLRSLRRGETYRYGIVFYDNKGRRSDVIKLGDRKVPEIEFTLAGLPFTLKNDIVENAAELSLYAKPIGIQFEIPRVILSLDSEIQLKDIVGCLIVRRSSKDIYQNTLLQVALSRPISQGLSEITDLMEPNKYSPFYPSGFLAVNNINIFPTCYFNFWDEKYTDKTDKLHATTKNTDLFLIFSSEIDFARDDVYARLNLSDVTIKDQFYLFGEFNRYTSGGIDSELNIRLNKNLPPKVPEECSTPFRGLLFSIEREFGASSLPTISPRPGFDEPSYANVNGLPYHPNAANINRLTTEKLSPDLKLNRSYVFNYFSSFKSGRSYLAEDLHESVGIKAIKDVKIPEWNSAFVEIQMDSESNIIDAIKKYKQYNTTVSKYTYNNFISFNKYDFTPGKSRDVNQLNNVHPCLGEMISPYSAYAEWSGVNDETTPSSYSGGSGGEYQVQAIRNGYIGAGTSCFLIVTDKEMGNFNTNGLAFATSICNIQHPIKFDEIESDEQILYFGFGNYFKLKTNANNELVLEDGSKKIIVFDGDIYITPHEFTTMHKVYNFESVDTLQSTQITNYVPLESKVNTYFDYGMNLLNTESANLLYEPGSIDGVTTQERPLHQYNMVYSDNDASNDVFTLISTDKNETNKFKQRAYYSEPKINGEFIDNFLIFKAVAFIDVDSTYGLITNLHSDKNNLYYWQDHAFGKFSVNERSLINDTNGNTIMLGQAGILSRYDYLSTQFGMRLYDFCSRSTESGLYWVDINNKAVVAADGGKVVNYGEYVGVQNIINNNLTSDKDVPPQVDYDLLNNELLCKCFGQDQLVFNVKYNMATSIYTRRYKAMAYIKNHTFGIDIANRKFVIHKHNYIDYNKDLKSFLSPMQLWFIVNPIASVTKVYDSLQIVPIKRSGYLPAAFTGSKLTFDTDIYNPTSITLKDRYTDREGNLIYNVPRLDNVEYGNRIRGKWMLVKFNNNNPTQYVTLSHVITKYRQSFS